MPIGILRCTWVPVYVLLLYDFVPIWIVPRGAL